MPINSRRKGARTERALARLLQNHGFAAEKVSRTGYRGHDLSIVLLGRNLRCEVKCRGNGFKEIYTWINSVDFLLVKRDRSDPLLICKLKLASEIAAIAEQAFIAAQPVKETQSRAMT